MRRFLLCRKADITGVSGVGIVAEGIEFSDGTVVLRWMGGHRSTVIWEGIEHARAIHGHDGATEFQYLDDGDDS